MNSNEERSRAEATRRAAQEEDPGSLISSLRADAERFKKIAEVALSKEEDLRVELEKKEKELANYRFETKKLEARILKHEGATEAHNSFIEMLLYKLKD